MTDELPEEETPETPGFKAEAERRWKAEGLYDEATKYRTERRVQYRDSGLTRKDAGVKAWDDTLQKYPPLGTESVEPPEIEMTESPESEEVTVHIPATDMDVAGDIAWAYEHLGDEKVRADQSPSAGAWSMLQYGRQARHKFLELVTKYDQSAKGDDDEDKELRADADAHINAIQKLLSITEAVHYEAVLDAIRQSPGEVERALKKAGWDVTRPAEEPESVHV